MAAIELTVFQVILLFWSLRTAESQVMMTRPGCDSYCGNISIPYPFGMKEGCYLDESFKILCNSSRGVLPQLTVDGTDLEVRYISVDDSTIEVMFPIVFANCNGKDRNTVVDLEGSPFVFSSENYFIARGCDNLALMTQNQSTIGGCVSICKKNSDSMMASCSGIDCCQTRIPSFLKVFNVTMKELDDEKGSSVEKQCRYAYLIYQRRINYGRYYYVGGNFDPYDKRDSDHVPVVLDWGVDRRVFESPVLNGSFPYSYSWCKNVMNSSINSTNQSSTFTCSCYPGFKGNPYLYGSCTQAEGRIYLPYNDRRKINAKMAGLGMLLLLFHSISS
uniref:Wall-associated receptor kinase galacturonan-binding domain-containing protein n=1 Tax=Populus davidiana TaxID=266767 RepID=A0A6M2F4G7_9ROSI